MAWRVAFTANVLDKLLDLPKKIQAKFSYVTEILEKDPDPRSHPSLCKIKGRNRQNLCRVKLTQKYRAFYKYDKSYVTVIEILKRDDDTYKPEFLESISCEEDIVPIWDIDDEEVPQSNEEQKTWFSLEQLTKWNIPNCYWDELLVVEFNEVDQLLQVLEGISEPHISNRILNILCPTKTVEELADSPEYELSDTLLDDYLNGNKKLSDLILRLSEEQQNILDLSREIPILVKGGPGTGKSVLALHFAVKMARENVSSRPVLLTTYNKGLVKWFKTLIKPLQETYSLSGDEIEIKSTQDVATEYYKSCYGYPTLSDPDVNQFYLESVIKEYQSLNPRKPIPLGGKIEDLLAEFQFFIEARRDIETPEAYISLRKGIERKHQKDIFELYKRWKDALEQDGFTTVEQVFQKALLISVEQTEKYEALVVDEAQDLSTVALDFLVNTCAKRQNVFLAADIEQSLYQRSYGWDHIEASVGHRLKTRELHKSFRNTEQISKANVEILPSDMFGEPSKDTGKKPEIILTDSLNQQAQCIKEFFEDSSKRFHLPIRRCSAVLVPSAKYGKLIANQLTYLGLESQYVSSEGLSTEDNLLKILTLNDSKGLEFQFVAVVGLEEGRLPTTPSLNILDEDAKELLIQKRRLFYVACSRAMRALLICASRTNPSQFIKPLVSSKFWSHREL